MAMRRTLILIISIYEVTSYSHPYGAKPFYPRGPRPREISYVADPRIQQGFTRHPYGLQETPANYPVTQNSVEPSSYQIYQQAVDPTPANYPIIYQHPLESYPASYPIYQQAVPEPNAVNYPILKQPVELSPAQPIYQPVEAITEIQAVPPIAPPVAPVPPIQNGKAGFDSNVLNNLAIALQLLILNNLINNPVPNSAGLDAINAFDGAKVAKPCEADYPALLNSKFLGSSTFDDASSMISYAYGSPVTSPRVGSLLKSPYDYLSASSSSSSSEYPSKSNLQNPYAAIFAPDNIKELFTISDYY